MCEQNNQAIFSARDVEMLRYALAYVKKAGVEKFEEEVAGIVQDPQWQTLAKGTFHFQRNKYGEIVAWIEPSENCDDLPFVQNAVAILIEQGLVHNANVTIRHNVRDEFEFTYPQLLLRNGYLQQHFKSEINPLMPNADKICRVLQARNHRVFLEKSQVLKIRRMTGK